MAPICFSLNQDQRQRHQIIADNAKNQQIQQTSLVELHKLNITLSNYYDVAQMTMFEVCMERKILRFVTEHEGEKYFFCSKWCKTSYDRYLPNTYNETHKLVHPE